MKKFEYTSIKMKPKSKAFTRELEDEKLMEEMNVLGEQGWELVTSMDLAAGGTTRSIVLIFKRIIE